MSTKLIILYLPVMSSTVASNLFSDCSPILNKIYVINKIVVN